MLKKTISSLKEVNKQKDNLKNIEQLIIQISNKLDLTNVNKFYTNYKKRFKGIQIKSNLTKPNLKESKINFFSIIINNKNQINSSILNCKSKNNFVELIIPTNIFEKIHLSQIERVNRIILNIKSPTDLKNIKTHFATLVANRFYPIFRGVPFCNETSLIQHNYDLFTNKIEHKNKNITCQKCIFKKYCEPNNKFPLKPIKNKIKFKEILEFLEQNENIINRI
ncbi:hypothetical protein HN587_00975 [Candidatus Woesearchaeota archaeon]|jgi:hypothetical protein|nr:hypothetical protein [Candidatus Woesearchaeota archaeon]